MTDALLAFQIIGVFTIATIVLVPVLCWVLPHNFYPS